MKKVTKVSFIMIAFYMMFTLLDMDDKIFLKVMNYINIYEGKESLELDTYKVKIDAKPVIGIKDNLSDITYSPITNTLFSVLNSPRKIYELSLEGEVLRVIDLHGFKDTEGITFMYGSYFAITDERLQTFYVIRINEQTKSINRSTVVKQFKLHNGSFENFGYEGIAFNSNINEFYLVNEKFLLQVITISNWLGEEGLSILFENQFSSIENYASDLSGVHYSISNNHVLFLSDESQLLTEVDMQGNKISFMDLEQDFVGLKEDIPQAEGITMDNENNIYIVSEPNLFYKLSKNN